MKTIPVDVSRVTTYVGGAIVPATTNDGSPRRDASGRPQLNVPIVAVSETATAEAFVVRVPGPLPQLQVMTPVKLVGLVARPWSMETRSGVSFSAETLQPVASPRS